jgi:hypothetical protein
VVYSPGLALIPEVLQKDGVSEQTYNTTQGPSLWTETLPIPQGDKIKLNVFVATGGADLKEIIVRLDNARIADITTAPWSETLDTANMQAGYHMIEVWAQASGNPPQAATKTLTFFVTKDLAPQYRVEGSQQVLYQGTVTNLTPGAKTDINAAPVLPDFLKGKSQDLSAGIVVYMQSSASSPTTSGAAVPDTTGPLTINEPTLFYVQAAPGSTAVRYAYALVRDGTTINTSTAPLELNYDRIRIEERSSTRSGLAPGTVMMWVWGVDADNRPSAPAKVQIVLP